MFFHHLKYVLTLAVFVLLSCNREAKRQCKEIKKSKISAPIAVTIGDNLTISAPEVGGFRIYNWDGPNFFDSQDPENILTDVGLRNRGVYSVHLYTLEDRTCESFDSVFVDVLLQQGSPNCSSVDNTVSFNNQGVSEYSLVIQSIDASSNQKKIAASGLSGHCEIYFHPSWNTQSIKSGIYTTANTASMDLADGDYNKVFIGITKNNLFWGCLENQSVYLTNSQGKLTAVFCDLNFVANNGASLSSIVSGKLIQQ